jgi:hypothetical protein
MTIIPATRKVKIRRITIPDQSRKKVSKTLIPTNILGVVAPACNPSYWEV